MFDYKKSMNNIYKFFLQQGYDFLHCHQLQVIQSVVLLRTQYLDNKSDITQQKFAFLIQFLNG